MPTARASGATVMGEPAGGAGAGACSSFDNPQLYYSVTIPAATRANFTVTRGGTNNVRARILDSCTAMTCSVSTSTVDAMATPFSITNTTAAPVTNVIAVSGTVLPGTFSLAYVGTNPVAPNASCGTPTAVAPGGMTTINTAMGGTRPIVCSTTEGDVLYYSVAVPAGSSVNLSLTRSGATNMRMRVLDSCTAVSCVNSVATASATAVTASLVNGGAAARTFIVAVGAPGSSRPKGQATLAGGPRR